jgi:glycosyltransferase involved in cell wall biosynthesis
LLWSLLAPKGYTFQITLAPQNPLWQKIYNGWVEFATELYLPVEFNAGCTTDFSELVQNAEALISTSIAEGFGLSFLEPWLEGKMLVGRNLPEITSDFEEEGLDLSTLYSALPVPIEWAGAEPFFKTLETAMKKSYASYSREWEEEYFEQAKAMLVIEGKVDFGILDEKLQRNVIRHLAENPSDRTQLPPLFPEPDFSLIEHNRRIVTEHYSPEAYGERLLKLYSELAAVKSGNVTSAKASGLLDEFLDPQRFNLLRT